MDVFYMEVIMNHSLIFIDKSIQNKTVSAEFKKSHSIEMGNYFLIKIPNHSITIWCRTFEFLLCSKATFDTLNFWKVGLVAQKKRKTLSEFSQLNHWKSVLFQVEIGIQYSEYSISYLSTHWLAFYPDTQPPIFESRSVTVSSLHQSPNLI